MNAVEDVRCEGSNYEFLAADNNLVRLLGHGVICQYLVSAFAHHKPVLVETCGHSLLELDIGSWKQGRQLPSLQLDHT